MNALNDVYMMIAIEEAKVHLGATTPNPPVGAVIVYQNQIIAKAAHHRAGQPHAEVNALNQVKEKFGLKASREILKKSTLYVTLEPCNHVGKTPPCCQAILNAGIKDVVVGAHDPNPLVSGGGIQTLIENKVRISSGILAQECQQLISGFRSWAVLKRPWVTHKLAYRIDQNQHLTMIPKANQKTFTSKGQLTLAHQLRRRSDAIITTFATIQKDQPGFDVRFVADHPVKKRIIAVLSRNHQKSDLKKSWLKRQHSLGHNIVFYNDFKKALTALAQHNVHHALIEAGPNFSALVTANHWADQTVYFIKESKREYVYWNY